jgi:tRNA(adenine34) deaminase
VSDELLSFLGSLGPEHYMRQALREAEKAYEAAEVPVGAVIVDVPSGRIIARAHNQRELLSDPTAHAEVLAITQAAAHYKSWRLSDAALFVTLEPCLMCSGAIIAARLPQVYYGTVDPKSGAHRSAFDVLVHPRNNHFPRVESGFLEPECSRILKAFFAARRPARPNPTGADSSGPSTSREAGPRTNGQRHHGDPAGQIGTDELGRDEFGADELGREIV